MGLPVLAEFGFQTTQLFGRFCTAAARHTSSAR
jgi:hypothetical protein